MDEPGTSTATHLDRSEIKTTNRPSSSGRSPVFLLVGIAVIALAIGGYFLIGRGSSEKATAQEGESHGGEKDSGDLPVEIAYPRSGGVERITTQAGSVHAFEYAALYAKISGYLKVQNVDIGDRVKIGQLLAVIEDPEVDKAVDQNQASLDQSKARVRVAEAKVRSASANREASEALVKQAETMVAAKLSNQDLQSKQLKRITGLVNSNAVERKLEDEQQDRYDVATADLGVARAEVISAKADVMSKAALIEEADADLIEAKANVEIAQANLAKAKVMQEYTRITSPLRWRGDDPKLPPGATSSDRRPREETSRSWRSPGPTSCVWSFPCLTLMSPMSTRATRRPFRWMPFEVASFTARFPDSPRPKIRKAGT